MFLPRPADQILLSQKQESTKNMKNRLILTTLLSAFALTGVANAQTGSGTLGVGADLSGSISLTFVTDASGIALAGTTTSTASLAFGTVSFYGASVPSGVTKTVNGTTSFSLATPFDVRADLANSASATYILTATLATPDATNVWLIGATALSDGGAAQLTATGAYATAVPYTLHLTIPRTEAAGTISNSIGFTAVGN
jgi:hypothetical protein